MVWFPIAIFLAATLVGFIAGFFIAKRNSWESAFERKFGFKPPKSSRHIAAYDQERVDVVLSERAELFMEFSSFQGAVLQSVKRMLGEYVRPSSILDSLKEIVKEAKKREKESRALKNRYETYERHERCDDIFKEAKEGEKLLLSLRNKYERYEKCDDIDKLEELIRKDAVMLRNDFWFCRECAMRCGFKVRSSIKEYSAPLVS